MKRQLLPVALVAGMLFILSMSGCDVIQKVLNRKAQSQPNLSLNEAKYRLIDYFGGMGTDKGIFYCDPDFYPVARLGAEQQNAAKLFPSIQQETETFQAILSHLNLSATTNFSDAQKLSIYQDYKHLKAINLTATPAAGYTFQLNVQNPTSSHVEGVISLQGVITIARSQAAGRLSCPLCLAANTLIDTPSGQIAVKDLQPGTMVWTADTLGQRQAVVILQTVRVPVPAGHQVVDLRLSDGRQLLASPGHPTSDGRLLGNLVAGDTLDRATILSAEHITYQDVATYDLLPAGTTGYYWANGILMGSTLHVAR